MGNFEGLHEDEDESDEPHESLCVNFTKEEMKWYDKLEDMIFFEGEEDD